MTDLSAGDRPRRLRIFFIAQRVPFPPDRGDKITTCNEVRHLARRHEVHVFCTADGADDMANVDGLRQIVASVTAVPVNTAMAKPRALLALLTGRPLAEAMIDEAALHAALRKAKAEMPPDLVFVYSSNTAQYAEIFAGTPRVMQFADLDSIKWERYAAETRPPMCWVYAIEARRTRALERRVAYSYQHSLVCTDNERRDFERLIPGAAISTAGNGVDLDYFTSAGVAKSRGGLIFTGVMDYLPNVDAVSWFARDILPLVRAEVPEAHFVICGSKPAPAVQALAALPGVTVTGRVPDVRPFLDAADVFVGPLRIARGIQNKVLEAMAMGLPVVATEQVRRGAAIERGEGIEAADDAAGFAAHVVALLRDDAYRARMGAAGRRAVERDYTWEAQLRTLDRVVTEATTPA